MDPGREVLYNVWKRALKKVYEPLIYVNCIRLGTQLPLAVCMLWGVCAGKT